MIHFLLQLVCVGLLNRSDRESQLPKQGKAKTEGEGGSGACLFPSPRSGGRLAILNHPFLAEVYGLVGIYGVGGVAGGASGGAGDEEAAEEEGIGRGGGVSGVETAGTDVLPDLRRSRPVLGGRRDGGGGRGGFAGHGDWRERNARRKRKGVGGAAERSFSIR